MFNNLIQIIGEKVEQYIKKIKQLSNYCNFSTSLIKHLRDHLLSGIYYNEIVRDK